MEKKNKKTCKEEGCDSEVYMRKLCPYHYQGYLFEKARSKDLKKQSDTTLPKSSKSRSQRIPTPKKRVFVDFNAEDLSIYSVSQLKRTLHYFCRQRALRKAKRNGQGKIQCFITGKWTDESYLELAHLIPRQKMCTAFDERNLHLVTKQSNTHDDQIYNIESYGKGISKHIFEYTEKYIDTYGQKAYLDLVEDSNQRCIWTKELLINEIKKIRKL